MGDMKQRIQISLRGVLLIVTVLAIVLGVYGTIRNRLSAGSATQPASIAPLATGILDSVTVWNKPVQRPGESGGNEGNTPPPGSQVEVYENFILITPPNGSTILSPHGWYITFMWLLFVVATAAFRRYKRFSLRTLLIGMTVASIVLGVAANTIR